LEKKRKIQGSARNAESRVKTQRRTILRSARWETTTATSLTATNIAGIAGKNYKKERRKRSKGRIFARPELLLF
jgi:hypothetical protein